MAERLEIRGLSKPQARRRFADLQIDGFHPKPELPPALDEIRQSVLLAYSSVASASEITRDRTVGLALYAAIPPGRISLRAAADDGVWRYLSLDVFPDLVHQRNPSAGDEWFWNSRWRIWLKRVWWLIYLSWQGDADSTRSVLQRWTTDTVAQFVERPGRGFRVDLCRSIAAESAKRKFDEAHFRRIMKLNTAWLATFDPTVTAALLQPYVERLFSATASQRKE